MTTPQMHAAMTRYGNDADTETAASAYRQKLIEANDAFCELLLEHHRERMGMVEKPGTDSPIVMRPVMEARLQTNWDF